jgi:hypothetical protein
VEYMRERQHVIRGDGDDESQPQGNSPSRPEAGPSAAGHGRGHSDAPPGDTMDACIRDLVASAPPLTPAQRDRLALLFGRPSRRPPARAARDRQYGQPGTAGLTPPPNRGDPAALRAGLQALAPWRPVPPAQPGRSSPAASSAPRPAPAALVVPPAQPGTTAPRPPFRPPRHHAAARWPRARPALNPLPAASRITLPDTRNQSSPRNRHGTGTPPGPEPGPPDTWISWHRWTAICLLAYIFFAVAAAFQRARDEDVDILGLIPVTIPELLRQLRGTVIPEPAATGPAATDGRYGAAATSTAPGKHTSAGTPTPIRYPTNDLQLP